MVEAPVALVIQKDLGIAKGLIGTLGALRTTKKGTIRIRGHPKDPWGFQRGFGTTLRDPQGDRQANGREVCPGIPKKK